MIGCILPVRSAAFLSGQQLSPCCMHMLYHLKSGGVSLKTQESVLIRYDSKGESAAQIILRSFDIFLEKELKNMEKYRLPVITNCIIDTMNGGLSQEA